MPTEICWRASRDAGDAGCEAGDLLPRSCPRISRPLNPLQLCPGSTGEGGHAHVSSPLSSVSRASRSQGDSPMLHACTMIGQRRAARLWALLGVCFAGSDGHMYAYGHDYLQRCHEHRARARNACCSRWQQPAAHPASHLCTSRDIVVSASSGEGCLAARSAATSAGASWPVHDSYNAGWLARKAKKMAGKAGIQRATACRASRSAGLARRVVACMWWGGGGSEPVGRAL